MIPDPRTGKGLAGIPSEGSFSEAGALLPPDRPSHRNTAREWASDSRDRGGLYHIPPSGPSGERDGHSQYLFILILRDGGFANDWGVFSQLGCSCVGLWHERAERVFNTDLSTQKKKAYLTKHEHVVTMCVYTQ